MSISESGSPFREPIEIRCMDFARVPSHESDPVIQVVDSDEKDVWAFRVCKDEGLKRKEEKKDSSDSFYGGHV